MLAVAVLAVVLVAVAVTYPWATLAAIMAAAAWAVAAHRRNRRPALNPPPPPTLERRVAERRAWADLHAIEAATGLPPTRRRKDP